MQIIYNKTFFLFVAIFFNVVTITVIMGILQNKEKLKKVILRSKVLHTELPFLPKFCSSKAMICYAVTLGLVSAVFFNYAMPFQFMVFGLVAVVVFFNYSNKLTVGWQKFGPSQFAKKLFTTAVVIRLLYVVFIYFYYIVMTGEPHMYHAADSMWYQFMASRWREEGYEEFEFWLSGVGLDDVGYIWWLAIEYCVLGTGVLPPRLIKCLIDAFSCVLIYSLAERNFGERTARIAAIFYMLMPNTWYYCGVTLKETEMAFLTILFVERADMAMRAPKIVLKDLLAPLLTIIVMFTFRTAMAAVLAAALAAAMILSSKKQMQTWKKVLLSGIFAVWMLATVGVELVQEAQMMWEGRMETQESGYQYRAVADNGNTFAKYASASIFAPLIFTLPFSSMVSIPGQENQMMLNGGNFIKNVLSGFVIFSIFVMLFRREWRQHVLPLAVMCGYLFVLVFSNFAHSERFHFPILGFELLFAAYGVSQMTNKHKRWYVIWLAVVCIANFAWAMIKLRGRGFA